VIATSSFGAPSRSAKSRSPFPRPQAENTALIYCLIDRAFKFATETKGSAVARMHPLQPGTAFGGESEAGVVHAERAEYALSKIAENAFTHLLNCLADLIT
jgi:hypothetical protein